jgi:hypothetical protein
MAWCARCMFPTPWADTITARDRTDLSDWPDIWSHGDASGQGQEDLAAFAEPAFRPPGFWPRRKLHNVMAGRASRQQIY